MFSVKIVEIERRVVGSIVKAEQILEEMYKAGYHIVGQSEADNTLTYTFLRQELSVLQALRGSNDHQVVGVH